MQARKAKRQLLPSLKVSTKCHPGLTKMAYVACGEEMTGALESGEVGKFLCRFGMRCVVWDSTAMQRLATWEVSPELRLQGGPSHEVKPSLDSLDDV